jgi:hypothetical protein
MKRVPPPLTTFAAQVSDFFADSAALPAVISVVLTSMAGGIENSH